MAAQLERVGQRTAVAARHQQRRGEQQQHDPGQLEAVRGGGVEHDAHEARHEDQRDEDQEQPPVGADDLHRAEGVGDDHQDQRGVVELAADAPEHPDRQAPHRALRDSQPGQRQALGDGHRIGQVGAAAVGQPVRQPQQPQRGDRHVPERELPGLRDRPEDQPDQQHAQRVAEQRHRRLAQVRARGLGGDRRFRRPARRVAGGVGCSRRRRRAGAHPGALSHASHAGRRGRPRAPSAPSVPSAPSG